MTLLHLSLEGLTELEDGLPTSITLDEHGVVIGRSRNCNWCLPDSRNHVSGRHCEIDWRGGYYWITDPGSTNGTFIDGVDLRSGPPRALQGGERIVIGPGSYTIRVELDSAAAPRATGGGAPQPDYSGDVWGADDPSAPPTPAAPPQSAPPGGDWGHAPPVRGRRWDPAGPGGGAARHPEPSGADDGPIAPGPGPRRADVGVSQPPAPGDGWGQAPTTGGRRGWGVTGPTAEAPPRAEPPSAAGEGPRARQGPPAAAPEDPYARFNAPPSEDPDHEDPWEAFFDSNKLPERDAARELAAPPPPPQEVAPSYQPAATGHDPGPAPSAETRQPAPRPTGPSAGDLAWAAFLDAAGIDPEDLAVSPEQAGATAGTALSDLVAGLMLMLQARAKAKHQLGAISSTFMENPLKLPYDAAVIATILLNPPERGNLSTEKAIDSAFLDLQAHQMAVLAAMQQALRTTLDRFSPSAIRGRAHARGGFLPGSREAALWKAYEREFDGVASGSDEAFLDLFAKAFRRAYDEHSRNG